MVSLSLLRCQGINCLVAYFLLDLMKDLVLAGISQLNITRSHHRNLPLTSFSRLRRYEALHKQCGPYTKSYNKTLEQLKSGHYTGPSECNYVVWISFSGLGNRMLSLNSSFLYALLTNRVLLVDPGVDVADLVCEPFPEVSWFPPPDFQLKNQFNNFNQESPQCYGKMLKNITITNSNRLTPPSVYLHLVHDYVIMISFSSVMKIKLFCRKCLG